MKCCEKCFGDQFLKEVIESIPNKTGTCFYCGSASQLLVPPEKIAYHFDVLLDIYIVSDVPHAAHLHDLLISDWCMCTSLEREAFEQLFAIVLPFTSITDERFVSKSSDDNAVELWDKFKEELKHENRFFPEIAPDQSTFETLYEFVSLEISPGESGDLFRARSGVLTEPYSPDGMMMPSKKRASEGRANPFGIPYLYLASDPRTAVAEIRPHTGECVFVATFKVIEKLRLVDLRAPRASVSPFDLDEDNLEALHKGLNLLDKLGHELRKPVLPKEAKFEYLPTQFLCESAKSLGFDGVLFRSSVGRGDNYAIFKTPKLEIVSTSITPYEVTSVNFDISPLAPA